MMRHVVNRRVGRAAFLLSAIGGRRGMTVSVAVVMTRRWVRLFLLVVTRAVVAERELHGTKWIATDRYAT